MKRFTKEDVLNRPELPLDEELNPRAFKVEEGWPHNQFWEGGKCFVPVVYQGQEFKRQQRIKHRGDVL